MCYKNMNEQEARIFDKKTSFLIELNKIISIICFWKNGKNDFCA